MGSVFLMVAMWRKKSNKQQEMAGFGWTGGELKMLIMKPKQKVYGIPALMLPFFRHECTN
jgi:hypothetical protein